MCSNFCRNAVPGQGDMERNMPQMQGRFAPIVPQVQQSKSLGCKWLGRTAGMSFNTQSMVVLRHALRLDEIDENFVHSSDAWWDPPLAPAGVQQVSPSRGAG